MRAEAQNVLEFGGSEGTVRPLEVLAWIPPETALSGLESGTDGGREGFGGTRS